MCDEKNEPKEIEITKDSVVACGYRFDRNSFEMAEKIMHQWARSDNFSPRFEVAKIFQILIDPEPVKLEM